MGLVIDRRAFVIGGTMGLGVLAVPGLAQGVAGGIASLRGFTHSVASGEPGPNSMLFWTRYVPAKGEMAELRVEVSDTSDFARIVASDVQITGPWRDYTAKITITGLVPGTRYFYRFVAPDGTKSPVGRTRTLPAGPTSRFRIAIFSCSNIGFGYFNAYAHAAARGDVDLAVHLGDYIYEYGPGVYPSDAQTVPGRLPEPATEIVALADYRLRYASYRLDPDLQALHAAVPMIVQWDDHESANDSWEGGAQNHQASEGDWATRRAAAFQAYREWMPISDEPWKAYGIGTLATLFRTETRLIARTKPPSFEKLLFAPDPMKALAEYRDGDWQDSAATMMGSTQEAWLASAMRASVRAGQKWQIVGFGTIMGETVMPLEAENWLSPTADARAKGYMKAGILAAKARLPFNLDNWGGYPAARRRFLASSQALGANTIVISGDSHNAWAYDLAHDGKAAAVEFAGHSVASPGYESALGADPKLVANGLVKANPELKWCDTSNRGYMLITLTPDRVINEWWMSESIRYRNPMAMLGHSATVLRGRNRMLAG